MSMVLPHGAQTHTRNANLIVRGRGFAPAGGIQRLQAANTTGRPLSTHECGSTGATSSASGSVGAICPPVPHVGAAGHRVGTLQLGVRPEGQQRQGRIALLRLPPTKSKSDLAVRCLPVPD